jgi:hypothetical protein
MKLSFRAAFCGVLALLSACAGNNAMQWRIKPPPVKDREICDQWGCERVTREKFNEVLRDIERQMRLP